MNEFFVPEAVPPRQGEKKEQEAQDPEENFYDLLELLGNELSKRWESELVPKIEKGEMTFTEASEQVEVILKEREKALYQKNTPLMKGSFEWMEIPLDGEQLNKTIDRLLSSRLEENILGSGAVAKVYRVENAPGICVKVVENEQNYHKGNTVFQESQFLEDLADFEVEGVRTPHFIQCFSGVRLNAIVMEEVYGATLEQIMNGDEEMPENFFFKDFFERLKKYFDALHTKNIFHLDIAPRNVMVDRVTGLPVVIDFGRGEHFAFSEDVRLEPEKDYAGLMAVKAETKSFLEGRRGQNHRTIDKESI